MSRSPVNEARGVPSAAPVARAYGFDLALWLFVGYVGLMALGFIVLRFRGAMVSGNEMSVPRALFAVSNAATLTGFQQNVLVADYAPLGRYVVLALMIGGTLLTLLIGGLALIRAAAFSYTDGQVIGATLITYALAIPISAVLLATPTRGFYPSAIQAASAFGNSGLYLGSLPGPTDPRTHLILMPLALLGGLSIPVLLDLFNLLAGQIRLSSHTRIVLTISALIYLLGVVAFTPWSAIDENTPLQTALANGSIHAINARSTGLPLLAVSNMSRVAIWLMIPFMIVGAAPAGTAGGLKVTTPFELTRGIIRIFRGQPITRLFAIAAIWTVLYIALIAITFLALLAIQPELPADKLLFISTSAIGCVGLSTDPLSMTSAGLVTLSIAMVAGRFAPLLVLWWTARAAPGSDLAIG